MAPTLSTNLFYTAAFLSSASVLGHTKMGYDVVFPALKKAPNVNSDGIKSAKIGWMECNQGFVYMAIFCLKWAQSGGPSDTYDKAFIGAYTVAQLWTAYAYIKAGIYKPLVVLFGIPAVVGAGLLL